MCLLFVTSTPHASVRGDGEKDWGREGRCEGGREGVEHSAEDWRGSKCFSLTRHDVYTIEQEQTKKVVLGEFGLRAPRAGCASESVLADPSSRYVGISSPII